MWRYYSIQSREFKPIMLMWTQYRINKEKLYFLIREKKNKMDSEEKEDILAATFINIINMANAFTNLQIYFIFSMRNFCLSKDCTKYFALADKS